MPATCKKRKAEQIEVPELAEDPSERRRVLNVIAQRRYRQRKREQLKRLENAANAIDGVSEVDDNNNRVSSESSNREGPPEFIPQTYTVEPVEEFVSRPSKPRTEEESSLFDLSCFRPSSDLIPDELSPAIFQVNPYTAWDPNTFFPTLSPLSSSSPPSDLNSLSCRSPSTHLPLGSGSAVARVQNRSTEPIRRQAQFRPSTQTSIETPSSFPDEAYLPSLELNLLRGTMTIARRLNVQELIWSLEANSPFNKTSDLTNDPNRVSLPDVSNTWMEHSHLPTNFRPTSVQILHAHHPILDIIPWPSVRDKLIFVLSQPEDLRPPSAASPTALLDFVYDLEDSVEGVRISGDDPFEGNNWEIGQKVFKNWWWAFDREVVRRSNELRQKRGASILGRGRVIGEVD